MYAILLALVLTGGLGDAHVPEPIDYGDIHGTNDDSRAPTCEEDCDQFEKECDRDCLSPDNALPLQACRTNCTTLGKQCLTECERERRGGSGGGGDEGADEGEVEDQDEE